MVKNGYRMGMFERVFIVNFKKIDGCAIVLLAVGSWRKYGESNDRV